jgi:hypothetical protein
MLSDDISIGDTAEELALIWGAALLDEYADRITYLPVSS